MSPSVADQPANRGNTCHGRNPFSFVGTLQHKASFYDLRERLRADSYTQVQDTAEILAVKQDQLKQSLRRRETITNLRQSIPDFQLPQKVKQIIGRKRSRDSDGDDHEEEGPTLEPARKIKAPKVRGNFWNRSGDYEDDPKAEPPRKIKARKIDSNWWNRYRAFRKQHNGIEAMVEAATVAHTYDEQHPLGRNPPHENEEALAFLEGRLSLCDTPGWAGGDIETVQRFLNSENCGLRTPVFNMVPDFSWAGNELEDFRLFAKAADDKDWLQDAMEI